MNDYRIINVPVPSRGVILIAYAEKFEETQSQEWREFTRNMYKFQTELYANGFHCPCLGRLIELENFTFYEEYLPKDTTALVFIDFNNEAMRKEIDYFIRYSFAYGLDPVILYRRATLLSKINDGDDKKKRYWFGNVLFLQPLDKDTAVKKLLTEWTRGKKYEVFNLLKESESLKWKSLFLAESVKNRLVLLFRKVISWIRGPNFSKNVLITTLGVEK